jgi:hypothetical protein
MRQLLVRPEGADGVGDWPGITSNISKTGILLAIPFSVAVGKVLVLQPWRSNNSRTVRVRVVRSWMESFIWFHGCEFIQPLTHAQLKAWLG